MSSCKSERFFVFRRFKAYVRSSMRQIQLNDIFIIHVYRDKEINLDIVVNQYIFYI